jgi:hypothetical protein
MREANSFQFWGATESTSGRFTESYWLASRQRWWCVSIRFAYGRGPTQLPQFSRSLMEYIRIWRYPPFGIKRDPSSSRDWIVFISYYWSLFHLAKVVTRSGLVLRPRPLSKIQVYIVQARRLGSLRARDWCCRFFGEETPVHKFY